MKRRNVVPSPLSAGSIPNWFIASATVLILICLPALPAAAAAEGSFQRSLQVTGPVHMELSTGSGSVEVRTGSAG